MILRARELLSSQPRVSPSSPSVKCAAGSRLLWGQLDLASLTAFPEGIIIAAVLYLLENDLCFQFRVSEFIK